MADLIYFRTIPYIPILLVMSFFCPIMNSNPWFNSYLLWDNYCWLTSNLLVFFSPWFSSLFEARKCSSLAPWSCPLCQENAMQICSGSGSKKNCWFRRWIKQKMRVLATAMVFLRLKTRFYHVLRGDSGIWVRRMTQEMGDCTMWMHVFNYPL